MQDEGRGQAKGHGGGRVYYEARSWGQGHSVSPWWASASRRGGADRTSQVLWEDTGQGRRLLHAVQPRHLRARFRRSTAVDERYPRQPC